MALIQPEVLRDSILHHTVLNVPRNGGAQSSNVSAFGIILDGGTATTDYGATVVVDGGAPATVNTYDFNGGTA